MADINAIYGVNPNSIPQPPDPLHVFQGWQSLANSILQNRLGQAQLTGTNISNQQATQDLKTKQSNRVAQQTFGLLTLPDDQLKSATLQTLRQELATGTIDQQTYGTWLSNLPSADAPVGQWRAAITAHLVGTMSGQEAVNNVIGTPSSINTGQSVQTGMVGGPLSRQPGSFAPSGSPVDVYPSRSELAGQVTQVDADPNSPTYGQQVTVPLSQRLTTQGAGNLAGPAAGSPGPSPANPPRLPGVAATPPAPGTNPAYDRLLVERNAQAQPATSLPAPAPGAVVTALPPGSPEVLAASAKQYVDDRATAGQYAQRMFPLVQAAALYKSGNVLTGPGSDVVNELRSFVSARASNIGVDPRSVSVSSFDELQKYLQQIVNSNPMSAGSDARLASALTGSPNIHISNMAGENVIKALIALERGKQNAMLSYTGSPQGYADYLKKYSTKVDVRAFLGDMQTKPEREKMLGNMSPRERKVYFETYQDAQKNGLFTNPSMPTPEVPATATPSQ